MVLNRLTCGFFLENRLLNIQLSIPSKIFIPYFHRGYFFLQTLISAVKDCLDLAKQHEAKSIAFPTLGAGFLKYPVGDVARILLSTIYSWMNSNPGVCLKEANIVVFSKDTASLEVWVVGEAELEVIEEICVATSCYNISNDNFFLSLYFLAIGEKQRFGQCLC